jgi:hypothetical protein
MSPGQFSTKWLFSANFRDVKVRAKLSQKVARRPSPCGYSRCWSQAETMHAGESDSFNSICALSYASVLSWRIANGKTDQKGAIVLTDGSAHNMKRNPMNNKIHVD